MTSQLLDKFGRPLRYLRISVTDRCNLRCTYCLPEENINFVKHKELLTYEEIFRLAEIFSQLGVNKIRITGGEPFVRKNLMSLIRDLTTLNDTNLYITSNGTLLGPHLNELKHLGIKGINLSLDTLNAKRFSEITGTNTLDQVLKSIDQIISIGIPLKVNCVLMKGVNEEDLIPLADLSKRNIVVRFIEQMPFNGKEGKLEFISHSEIESRLKETYPQLTKERGSSTATIYSIPGRPGKIGIIAAYSRTFCHSCDRIRLSATGMIKTCLYGHDRLDLKKLLRDGADDGTIAEHIREVYQSRRIDGFEAEKENDFKHQPMIVIGG